MAGFGRLLAPSVCDRGSSLLLAFPLMRPSRHSEAARPGPQRASLFRTRRRERDARAPSVAVVPALPAASRQSIRPRTDLDSKSADLASKCRVVAALRESTGTPGGVKPDTSKRLSQLHMTLCGAQVAWSFYDRAQSPCLRLGLGDTSANQKGCHEI